ncbi:GSTE3.2 family protein [Megaselia abdita]
MAKPTLYYLVPSPPSRCVLLTAKAIGLDLELIALNPMAGENRTEEFLEINPQHTIPTMVDGDVVITDSHAIVAYIVDKYAKNDHLYPKDIGKRAVVNSRLHFDSGHLFARLRFLYEPVLYNGSSDCSREKLTFIRDCYSIMEGFLKNSPYLCGSELTIADFSCISTLTSVNGVCPVDSWKYPKLSAWIDRLKAIPYFEEVNSTGAQTIKEVFQQMLDENKQKNILSVCD